ncbi:MAG TPA: ABC transporter substrate-binding protein [Candidatus Binatia bacterium]
MKFLRGVGLLVAVFLAASSSPRLAAAAGKFVVGYAAINTRLIPLWLAEEQGFFAKYGMESQAVFLRSATVLVTGLASGDIQVGSGGGSAALAAASAGQDIKIIGSFSTRNSYDFVARPNIKRAEDLRGKRVGVTSIGGGSWMGAMLWLEQLGLDPQRDQITMLAVGDQTVQSQAVENGVVDATVLDGVFSRRLRQKGFNIIGESDDLKKPMINQSAMVSSALLQQKPEIAENFLRAMIESIAFSFAPKNKSVVIKTIMRRLKADQNSAEEGYEDLLRAIERKPFPSVEGLRNAQRLMKLRTPKIGEINVDPIIDGRIMRKLEDSGFIAKVYAAQGTK